MTSIMRDTAKDDNESSKTYSSSIATLCYEWLIIITSVANTLIDIFLIIQFYNNKKWSDFGTILLSLQIFCHICYAVGFEKLYLYNVGDWIDWESANKKAKCQFILFLLTLLILSPIINLLIYLTSAQSLFLTKKLKSVCESSWIHGDETLEHTFYSWHEIEAKRLFGYVFVEFFVHNIPQFIFKLVIIDQVIQSTDYDYNSDSKMMLYLLFSFYLNLFVITLKSYCLWWFIPDSDDYNVNQLFLAWSSILADFSTFVYLFVWMYVLRWMLSCYRIFLTADVKKQCVYNLF